MSFTYGASPMPMTPGPILQWLRTPLAVCLAAGLPAGSWAAAPSPVVSVPVQQAGVRIHTNGNAFTVALKDPVYPDRPAARHEVVQLRDAEGRPTGYAMPLTADVCTDNKCNLVEVTLFWNEAGRYTRFECPPGKPLTKKEHTPFTPADYAKLDAILKDRDSLLARHSLAHLNQTPTPQTGPSDPGRGTAEKPQPQAERQEQKRQEQAQQALDGIAGATPAAVKEAVVQDAAYSSWVLWRYANGEIVQQLRQRTSQDCTPDLLRHYLRSADGSVVLFALQHLIDRQPTAREFSEEALRTIVSGDSERIALALRFLKGAEPDRERRHARLLALLPEMQGHHMPQLIEALSDEGELPAATLERLTADLQRLPYYPVHLILQQLEQRAFHSRRTEADVVRLLDNADFFLARRAYQHLLQLPARDEATAKRLEAFQAQHEGRL